MQRYVHGGVMVWGLGVRVPASSLFHDEKFAFFEFGVRGTPEILKILLGVRPKFSKNGGIFTSAAAAEAKKPFISKISAKNLRKLSKFWATPNPKVKKCEFLVVKEACRRNPHH